MIVVTVVKVVVVSVPGAVLTAAAIKLMRKYEQEAYAAYESLSGKKLERNEDGTFKPQGTGDDVDAFRHAYLSAVMTWKFGKCTAYAAGESVEIWGDLREYGFKHRNMDEWNNAEGRKIGLNTTTRDEIKMPFGKH